jgi:hypothetical protein
MTVQEEANPLHNQYFRYLYNLVVPNLEADGISSYGVVCTAMHNVIFKDKVPHDSNRIAMAAELRNEFLATDPHIFPHDRNDVLLRDASIFEVLVALAKDANLMIEMDAQKWFQIFLKNLRLDLYSDFYCLTHGIGHIFRVLRRFNERTYRENGSGGLFPLKFPGGDQRETELWYQLGAWVNEHNSV